MPASILYHCTCTSVPSSSVTGAPPAPLTAPPPQHPLHPFGFHPLPTLYFCEECDDVRCNRCVSVEVSGYYCPNCLFEVPSASVRAEKNRCARNCFLCPQCSNTLSIVSSDPPSNPDNRHPPVINSVGDPPFFLYCNYCRWDSAEAGITFDKPTGLALQLQKTEDSSPDTLEFDRLKEHFEPLIRISHAQSTAITAHTIQTHSHSALSAINAAASSALARDVPGLRRKRVDPNAAKDEYGAYYRSRIDSVSGGSEAHAEVEWLKDMTQEEFLLGDVSRLEQRWVGSWIQSLKSLDLKPLRIPLHSKQTKRCPKCRHILIKPEQKSQSTRYKIKLMAANYLPSIDVLLIPPLTSPPSAMPSRATGGKAKQSSAAADDANSGQALQQGKTYAFQLAFTNPLYEPIQVRMTVQRPQSKQGKRAPFAVSLPTSSFSISAFAEAWEYDDEEDAEIDDDDIEDMLAGRGSDAGPGARDSGKKGASNSTVGVLERKANVTKVGGEVVIGRESDGNVEFNVLVSYTYRADDPTEETGSSAAPRTAVTGGGENKTFSFYIVVDLGTISATS